nr:uncharacterized protein LOC105474952 [Macaca nemestrina]
MSLVLHWLWNQAFHLPAAPCRSSTSKDLVFFSTQFQYCRFCASPTARACVPPPCGRVPSDHTPSTGSCLFRAFNAIFRSFCSLQAWNSGPDCVTNGASPLDIQRPLQLYRTEARLSLGSHIQVNGTAFCPVVQAAPEKHPLFFNASHAAYPHQAAGLSFSPKHTWMGPLLAALSPWASLSLGVCGQPLVGSLLQLFPVLYCTEQPVSFETQIRA